MQSFLEDQNTLVHVANELAAVMSSSGSNSTEFRIASPAPSSHSNATSIETNQGSDTYTPTSFASAVLAVGREGGIAFNLADWGWQEAPAVGFEEPPSGPTPRQRTLSLPRVVVSGSGPFAQLRPIPPEVPESCPSLYRPGPGSLVNDEEDDDDDRTEAESIWFCNADADAQVVTSASVQAFPTLIEMDNVEPVRFNPPEAFEDFPDLQAIVAHLQTTTEDIIVDGAMIEDLNSL